jgi:hypothetical protein
MSSELFSKNFYDVEDDSSINDDVFAGDDMEVDMGVMAAANTEQQHTVSMAEPMAFPSIFFKQDTSPSLASTACSENTELSHHELRNESFQNTKQASLPRNSFLFQDMMREVRPNNEESSIASFHSSSSSVGNSRTSGGMTLPKQGSSSSIEALLAKKSMNKSSSGRSLVSACEAKRRNRLAKKQFQSESALAMRKRQHGLQSSSSVNASFSNQGNASWSQTGASRQHNASFSNFQF